MRKLVVSATFCIFLINMSINRLYSQVTIGKIAKQIDTTFIKPEPYDSLCDFGKSRDKYGRLTSLNRADYKQYIGIQFYLPPLTNPNGEKYTKSPKPIVFSTTISTINIDTTNNQVWYVNNNDYFRNISLVKNHVSKYDKIATLIYKPYHYKTTEFKDGDLSFDICNSKEIGDKYYTLINVVQNGDFIQNYEIIKSKLQDYSTSNKNVIKCKLGTENRFDTDVMFQLRDNISGDTVYCYNLYKFILVPFFVKQKELCENKYFVCTGNGGAKLTDIKTNKKVAIEYDTRWRCNEVTLLNNIENEDISNYDLYYVLSNDSGNTIALNRNNWSDNKYFTEESIVLEKEKEKKLKQEDILAKQQQLKKEAERQEQIRIERKRTESINKYGQYLGDIIAQNKVKIGFKQDMCIDAWGIPFSKNKTTTELNVYESWYYIRGSELHFENGILKKIEE